MKGRKEIDMATRKPTVRKMATKKAAKPTKCPTCGRVKSTFRETNQLNDVRFTLINENNIHNDNLPLS
jgi:hypothetical protein